HRMRLGKLSATGHSGASPQFSVFWQVALLGLNITQFHTNSILHKMKVLINNLCMHRPHRWLELLDEEDLAFLKRFVLASGSLKELAQAYSISYPTVRLRLDRLIAKIEVFDSQTPMSPFERTLRGLHADGKIDLATLKTL